MSQETSTSISFKAINRLAFPAILSGLAEPIISIADTAIVGRISATAIGAVGLGTSLFMLIFWVFASMSGAMASLVGRYTGQGKEQEVESLIPQSILLGFAIGLFLLSATLPLADQLFKLYEATGDILTTSVEYYSIRAWGFPFALATTIIFGIFKGFQNTSWAMYITFSGAILNVILDFALIFGMDGWVSPMGVEGAALASFAAQILMFLLALGFLKFKIRVSWKLGEIHPELFYLLNMGANLIFRTIALSTTLFLADRFATSYGKLSIAAHTIAMKIWLFSSFLIDGYAHAGMAMMGRLLGAEEKQFIYPLGIRLCLTGIGISMGLCLIYLLGYNWIGPFFSKDAEVVNLFATIFWLLIISQPFNAIAFIFDGIYIGLGEIKYLRNNLLAATFLGFLPIAFLGDFFQWELTGIWIALLGWMLVRSLPLFLRFRKTFKQSTV